MNEVSSVGLDLAKNVFQTDGAGADEGVHSIANLASYWCPQLALLGSGQEHIGTGRLVQKLIRPDNQWPIYVDSRTKLILAWPS